LENGVSQSGIVSALMKGISQSGLLKADCILFGKWRFSKRRLSALRNAHHQSGKLILSALRNEVPQSGEMFSIFVNSHCFFYVFCFLAGNI
jgi:hypothetical protein